MDKNQPATPPEPTHRERFDALLGKVLSVPKKEIDRRKAEYQKRRSKTKKARKQSLK